MQRSGMVWRYGLPLLSSAIRGEGEEGPHNGPHGSCRLQSYTVGLSPG